MGLANLVPGISGGTMLVAAGIYPRFIRAISEITRFRLRPASLVLLGSVAGGAVVAIVVLADTVVWAVTEHRWIMYSLFIGLTLGGLPLLKRMVGRLSTQVVVGVVLGFGSMTALVLVQGDGSAGAATDDGNALLLLLAGVAGASAMILPGVSGAYLLLVLGQYVPILASIGRVKDAIKAADISAVMAEAGTLAPVAIGVLIGIVGVSNVLRLCLDRFEKPTLGVLMGLLLGSVVGLWPYQRPIDPIVGETVIKGTLVTLENIATFEPTDFPVVSYRPALWQPIVSVVLVASGFFVTLLIARLGGGRGRIGEGGVGGQRGREPATDALAAAADESDQ
jgi:putative membrane protein